MAENDPIRTLIEADLRLPASFAARIDVMTLGVTNSSRGFAAALGLSWRGKGRVVTPWTPRDPAAYGGAVLDELHGRGIPLGLIITRGGEAWQAVADSLTTAAEVAEAVGNSEAPAEAPSA